MVKLTSSFLEFYKNENGVIYIWLDSYRILPGQEPFVPFVRLIILSTRYKEIQWRSWVYWCQ